MGEKRINAELLETVKAMILEEPRRLNMNQFAALFSKAAEPSAARWEFRKEDAPPCGAVMCIAGHTLLAQERQKGFIRKRMTRQFVKRVNEAAEGEAQRLLGLDAEQAERLFFFREWRCSARGWPISFASAYLNAFTPQERAEITARRIDHFIQTNGQE